MSRSRDNIQELSGFETSGNVFLFVGVALAMFTSLALFSVIKLFSGSQGENLTMLQPETP